MGFTSRKKKDLADLLRSRKECPWARDAAPRVCEVERCFPDMHLDCRVNEVLLLHGTSQENAHKIAKHGFDERCNAQSYYGEGIYFTTDSCKAAQYCKPNAQS